MKARFVNIELHDELIRNFKTAKEIKIAVAYIKMSGLKLLQNELNKCKKRNQKVKVITGTDFYLTDASALSKLQRIQNVELKIAKTETYHPKLYLFDEKVSTIAVVGSSNLSRGGLSSNLEANIVLELNRKQDRKLIRSIHDSFDTLWTQHAGRVNDDWIEEFRKEQERTKEQRRKTQEMGTSLKSKIRIKSRKNLEKIIRGAKNYWLIIYHPLNIPVCREHGVISFNENNNTAMELFRQMKPNDIALCKESSITGGGNFREVWKIESNVYPNTLPRGFGDSEPWASEGVLDGKRFKSLADISRICSFDSKIKEYTGKIRFGGNQKRQLRGGLVKLKERQFKELCKLLGLI